jgi:general secretion pathway protein A
VEHRLQCAGGNINLFSAEAIEKIWQEAHGVPRVMNTLFDLALVYGFSCSKEFVDGDVADEVLADRSRMGLKAAPEPLISDQPTGSG